MTRKDVVIQALNFQEVPYVPWSWGPTVQCQKNLQEYLGMDDLDGFLQPHILRVGSPYGRGESIDENHTRDIYGVVWDRTVDKDIGSPVDWPIKTPADLDNYQWPDPSNPKWYEHIPGVMAEHPDKLIVYPVGFSLYERAWTMRGMTELLMDMIERPAFVEGFLDAIVEHNLVQVEKALELDVDAVYFGDDYGMQNGLIMGGENWRRFIKPRLAKMYGAVRDAGKFVFQHSCGKVTELFDDFVEIGLNCFNPFQPEVMDVFALMKQYHGRLAFHGGMSVQNILPFGSVDDVRAETKRLIEAGQHGGYIFSPSHSVPGDVPPENLVAMMELLTSQPGYES
jgi:uroporphyrinogen decarboxylase